MKKKKIAVIGLKGLPAFGGAATVGENIIEQLKDKYDFIVYSISSHTDLKTGAYNGYKQIVFRRIPLLNKINSLYYYVISALHAVFRENYNIIHLHHRVALFLIPFLRLKYRVILTTHGMEVEPKFKKIEILTKLQDLLFLRYANFITAVSLKDYRIVSKIVKSKKVIYIPNGISQNIKKNTQCNREKEHNDYILFAAGRIFKSKGCHTMLLALQKMGYSKKVIIAGDINQNKKYKKMLIELSKTLKNVEFIGMIKEKKKLYGLISNAKLFIYPSYLESMSIMLLETAFLKIPIICADIQENKDIFNETEVLYVKKENVFDWADKIKWALENEEEMKKKSLKAHKKLLNKYTWSIISKKYDKVFSDQINFTKKYD